jgi:hypothetical protein
VRGLPPLPPDVCRIETVWQLNSVQECSTSFNVFAPGSSSATTLQLSTLLGAFFFTPLQDLLTVIGTDVSCSALRLTTSGSAPFVVQEVPASNAGALTGSQALNAALVLTWRTAEPRVGGRSHTFLPLSGMLLDDDKVRLKSVSYSEAASAARTFVQHVSEMLSPDGATCALVVVHRSQGGAVLPVARMSFVELGDASPFVGTLQRRIRARRISSPSF